MWASGAELPRRGRGRPAARLLGLLALLLVACQPLPHPLAASHPHPDALLADLKDSVGVTVERVAGPPPAVGDRLAEAMAAALRDAEIPASTQARNSASYSLAGTAGERRIDAERTALEVDWELRGADGKPVGRHAETSAGHVAGWAEADAGLMTAMARASAPAIAALIEEPAPQAAANDGRPAVAVRAVAGAPGDGSRSLARAMTEALRRTTDILVAEREDGRTLVVAGRVAVAGPADGKQEVKVTWALLRPDGSQVGLVEQENAVPAGSLDHYWGDVAFVVANAAADGLLTLIEHAAPAAKGS